jgi:hypothetical protein
MVTKEIVFICDSCKFNDENDQCEYAAFPKSNNECPLFEWP